MDKRYRNHRFTWEYTPDDKAVVHCSCGWRSRKVNRRHRTFRNELRNEEAKHIADMATKEDQE